MFIIRDKDFRTVAVFDDLGTMLRKRPEVENIDIWPAGKKTQVGVTWADGSTTIGDVRWNSEATWMWLEMRGFASRVRHHVGRAA